MSGKAEEGHGEPRVAVCLYDFTLWYMQRTNRFPKNHRVTLGDQMQRTLYGLLNGLLRAVSQRQGKLVGIAERRDRLDFSVSVCLCESKK